MFSPFPPAPLDIPKSSLDPTLTKVARFSQHQLSQFLNFVIPKDIYSRAHKFVIFCFAQLHLQILVDYQNQGQFWNLLVLRIPKLSLKV